MPDWVRRTASPRRSAACFRAPHGAVCAALLPYVMRSQHPGASGARPRSEALRRYEEIARLLTGRPQASAEEGADFIADLGPRTGDSAAAAPNGVVEGDMPGLVGKAALPAA